MVFMNIINEDVFHELSDGSFSSYEEFCNYLKDNNLELKYFYADLDNMINRVWYLEDYITVPMMFLSKELFNVMRLPELVERRRNYSKKLVKERDYVRLFKMIDKPFRIAYFLDIYNLIEENEAIELFRYVYSSSEYGFNDLLNDDVIELLRDCIDTDNMRDILKTKFNIDDNIVTIYRGEADKSQSYKDGAMSWTLELEVAKFFASRFGCLNPKIYKAKANIDDILLYLERESEVLIESFDLIDVHLI